MPIIEEKLPTASGTPQKAAAAKTTRVSDPSLQACGAVAKILDTLEPKALAFVMGFLNSKYGGAS